MRRAMLLVALAVTVLAIVVGAALATPPNKGATTTLITRATLGKFEAHNDGIQVQSERHSADLAIAKVVIEPGGSTGWHHHPGVGPAAVKSGAVTFYDEDCEKTVYKAGEGFLESHDDPMLVRNRGSKAVRTVSVPC
jgi:quercetin dioxygenase-like cupin family protein